jgi:crossover junction endodeoxyribonuclease RusA
MDTTTPNSWTLVFDYPTNPVPMNGPHQHWSAPAKAKKVVRNHTRAQAIRAGIPVLGRCVVQLTWHVLTNGRRDVDNLANLEKAMYDGLVDALVVADDIPELMEKRRPEIVKVERGDNSTAWMTLTITRATEKLLLVGDGEHAKHWAQAHLLGLDAYDVINTPAKLLGRRTHGVARVILPPESRSKLAAAARADLIEALAITDAFGDRAAQLAEWEKYRS